MTTTSQFQIKPDYYTSQAECIRGSKQKSTNTNPRYPTFTQDHFTAGDENQFQLYRYEKNGQFNIPNIDLSKNLFKEHLLSSAILWEKYRDLTANAVIDTFRYIFHKLKKGLFVKILDNKLKVFLPFSKANYINEWSSQIHMNRESILALLEKIAKTNRYSFNPAYVHKNISEWYGNNCIVRYEYPISEGDSNVGIFKNLLDELCASRTIPDIEFFINRRDYPLLTKDGTEAYSNLWGSSMLQLVSHAYDKYSPILSMCSSDRYADVAMPTWDDWSRAQSMNNIFFSEKCKKYLDTFSVPWEQKQPKAVFRGSSTGCGTSIETNPRLKACAMSVDFPDYLDCGITTWNLRPRKHENSHVLKTIEIDKLPFGLANKLSPLEQSKFKYILNIDGHVSAFRLSLELSMNSVILLVNSSWKLWYSDMLKPYEHYVPVASDLSNLIDQVIWCREHDAECMQIAKNARLFYDTYLQKNGILDFIQKTLIDLKHQMGIYVYNIRNPLEAQLSYEQESLEGAQKKALINGLPGKPVTVPKFGRTYGKLRAIESMVNNELAKGFKFTPGETLFQSKRQNNTSLVFSSRIDGYMFAIKTVSDQKKQEEHLHQTFIGINSLNKLLNYIPNFSYTFGMYMEPTKICVVTEYIEGRETLSRYISSQKFNMNEFIFMLVQIALSLQVAQNLCGFVHWDLTPWNIMLQRTQSPVTFDYILEHNKVFKVETSIVPILIDYGKSHVIYNGCHYGYIDMFSCNTIQDIFSIVVISIAQIFENKKSYNVADMELLGKFLSCITYTSEKLTNMQSLRNYVMQAKKYTNLLTIRKKEIKPSDFVEYILKNKTNFPVTKITSYSSHMIRTNPDYILKYIYAQNDQSRTQSFIHTCELIQNQAKQLDTKSYSSIFMYLILQTLGNQVLSMETNWKNLGKEENNIFSDTIQILKNVYDKIPKVDTNTYDNIIHMLKNIIIEVKPKYTEETFLLPHKILSILESGKPCVSDEYHDLTEYKEILVYILSYTGPFAVSDENRVWYLKVFKNLINFDWYLLKVGCANRKTLVKMCNAIYPETLASVVAGGGTDIEVYEKIVAFKQ